MKKKSKFLSTGICTPTYKGKYDKYMFIKQYNNYVLLEFVQSGRKNQLIKNRSSK